MKLRIRNKTYIIMYHQSASTAGTASSQSNNGNRIREDCSNGNSLGRLTDSRVNKVPVPSVIGSFDMDGSGDLNSNVSVSSSSDTEESGSYIQDGIASTEGMDPLTVEAIKAIKSGKTRQRIRLEDLPPEEAQRRSVRRERNKMAAAKCRMRRVHQTNDLQGETAGLEETQASIQQEIEDLQQQKEQLEFILHAHKPICKLKSCGQGVNGNVCQTKLVNSGRQQPTTGIQSIRVKSEPHSPGIPSRPSTLPITSMSMGRSMTSTISLTSAEAATGIPITTPSGDGLFNFTVETPGTSLLTPTCSGHNVQKKVATSLETPSSTLNTPSSPTFMSL